MKHYVYVILTISCLLVTACQDDRIQVPKAYVQPTELHLSPDQPTAQFIVNVSGKFRMQWSLTHKPEWLAIDRTAGTVGGELITVTALTSNMVSQTLTDNIEIRTTSGIVVVPVTLTVNPTVDVRLNPNAFNFQYQGNTQTFTIVNDGHTIANWQIDPSALFMQVSPNSGTLNPGQSAEVTLTIDRTLLETKVYTEKLLLKLDGVAHAEAVTTVKNYKEEKWLLEDVVIDAEYDRVGDNLIILSNRKLLKLNPETRTMTSLSFLANSSGLSISADGHYAAVGHDEVAGNDASVSLVNLDEMTIEKVYSTSLPVFDVVLAPNNWIYAFPMGNEPTEIRCINMQDGSEVLGTGTKIYGRTTARLHPSGNYIYGYRTVITPTDAEKYDIRTGQANYLYESKYHGDYEFGNSPWIVGVDGDRMINYRGDVFTLSTDQAQDIIFEQRLTIENPIQGADYSPVRNMIAAAYLNYSEQPWKNDVKIFSADALNPIVTKSLPAFLYGESGEFPNYRVVASKTSFLFFNSTGTKVIAIVRPDMSAVTQDLLPWAVSTLTID